MKRKEFLGLMGAAALAVCLPVAAESPPQRNKTVKLAISGIR